MLQYTRRCLLGEACRSDMIFASVFSSPSLGVSVRQSVQPRIVAAWLLTDSPTPVVFPRDLSGPGRLA